MTGGRAVVRIELAGFPVSVLYYHIGASIQVNCSCFQIPFFRKNLNFLLCLVFNKGCELQVAKDSIVAFFTQSRDSQRFAVFRKIRYAKCL